MQLSPAASSSRAEGSGVAIGGGPGGGGPRGGMGGGGPSGGGAAGEPGFPGVPGGNEPPPEPTGKIGKKGRKIPDAGTGSCAIAVVGGGTMGNSAGVSMLASSAEAALSIVSGVGSTLDMGATGTADKRFPHRVRAIFAPSVRIASPARTVNGFLVQKMELPMR